MTDDRSSARLLTAAGATDTKVIGVGDPQQLQAIGPGGGFEETHRLVRGTVLHTDRCRPDAAECLALEVWRDGAREQALHMLADGSRVHATDTAEQAHQEILAAWNQQRRQWPDTHDTIANLVVLAARSTDVEALNAGAQAIRSAAGELGTTHTYARPRGEQLTLAVGDIVRARQNHYRSRRGAGPDALNGYRAVVTTIDDEHNVQITWRCGNGAHGQAWMSPGQIGHGAVSLGYAMTVATSQGLTADTALLYGLGANAYALYPGINRARSEIHLWLPAAALEDEATRARLGEPGSDTERLDRALHAYAVLLMQDRPGSMVSDQLRAVPEPVPPAVGAPAFPRWHDRDARPYGTLTDADLAARAADLTRRAGGAERKAGERARAAAAGAEELAQHPGQQIADNARNLIDAAAQLILRSQHDAEAAERARAAATSARDVCAGLQRATGRSRIALRLEGTSRAERQQLIATYAQQSEAAEREYEMRLQAAADARHEAEWTLESSPYTKALCDQVVGNPRPPAVQIEALEVMRQQLPALATQIDKDRAEAVRAARATAVDLRARAETLRVDAGRMQAEHGLRSRIAEQGPLQYHTEARQRDRFAVQQAQLAAQRRRSQAPRREEPSAAAGGSRVSM